MRDQFTVLLLPLEVEVSLATHYILYATVGQAMRGVNGRKCAQQRCSVCMKAASHGTLNVSYQHVACYVIILFFCEKKQAISWVLYRLSLTSTRVMGPPGVYVTIIYTA